jgi:hypothetical protein
MSSFFLNRSSRFLDERAWTTHNVNVGTRTLAVPLSTWSLVTEPSLIAAIEQTDFFVDAVDQPPPPRPQPPMMPQFFGPRKHDRAAEVVIAAIDDVEPELHDTSPFPSLLVTFPLLGVERDAYSDHKDVPGALAIQTARRIEAAKVYRLLAAALTPSEFTERLRCRELRFVALPSAADADAVAEIFSALAQCAPALRELSLLASFSRESHLLGCSRDAPPALMANEALWRSFTDLLRGCAYMRVVAMPPIVVADEAADIALHESECARAFAAGVRAHASLRRVCCYDLPLPSGRVCTSTHGNADGGLPAAIIALLLPLELGPLLVVRAPLSVSLVRELAARDRSWLAAVDKIDLGADDHTSSWGAALVVELCTLLAGAPKLTSLVINAPSLSDAIDSSIMELVRLAASCPQLRTLSFGFDHCDFWPAAATVRAVVDFMCDASCSLQELGLSGLITLEHWIASASRKPAGQADEPLGVTPFSAPCERALIYELVRRQAHPKVRTLALGIRSNMLTSPNPVAEVRAFCAAVGSNEQLRDITVPAFALPFLDQVSAALHANPSVRTVTLAAAVVAEVQVPPAVLEQFFASLPAHLAQVSMSWQFAACLSDEIEASQLANPLIAAIARGLSIRTVPLAALELTATSSVLAQLLAAYDGTNVLATSLELVRIHLRHQGPGIHYVADPDVETVEQLRVALTSAAGVDVAVMQATLLHIVFEAMKRRRIAECISMEDVYVSNAWLIQMADLFSQPTAVPTELRFGRLDMFQTYDSAAPATQQLVRSFMASLQQFRGAPCVVSTNECPAIVQRMFVDAGAPNVALRAREVVPPLRSYYVSKEQDQIALAAWSAAHLRSGQFLVGDQPFVFPLGKSEEEEEEDEDEEEKKKQKEEDGAQRDKVGELIALLTAARARGWHGNIELRLNDWSMVTPDVIERVMALSVDVVSFEHSSEDAVGYQFFAPVDIHLTPSGEERMYYRHKAQTDEEAQQATEARQRQLEHHREMRQRTGAVYEMLTRFASVSRIGCTRVFTDGLARGVRATNATVLEQFAARFRVHLVDGELPANGSRPFTLERAETRADHSYELATGAWVAGADPAAPNTVDCELCSRSISLLVDMSGRQRVAGAIPVDAVAPNATPNGIVIWTVDDVEEGPAEHMLSARAIPTCLACAPHAHKALDRDA